MAHHGFTDNFQEAVASLVSLGQNLTKINNMNSEDGAAFNDEEQHDICRRFQDTVRHFQS